MMDAPKSYKDPYWAQLASATERKLGIPDGLLGSIITKGERSNNDQVSEAGARTVAQIIPSTRDAVLKKYGVDAYLNPENAIEAAGLVLKEGLDRNGGNAAAAVAEYHGGVKRENWGPRTKAYVERVTGAQAQPATGQSTYARIKAQREAENPQAASIASVLDAYQSGKMAPEDAAQFEKDVNVGMVMLPQGRTLKGAATQAPTSDRLPQGVVDAYLNGQMPAEDKAALDRDIAAGLVDVPDGYGQYFKGSKAKTGAQLMEQVQPSAPTTPRRETTFGEDVVGVGEAALAAATGATTGTIGTIAGGVSQAVREAQAGQFGTPQAAQRIAAQAAQGGQAGTFAPRTEAGQRSAQQLAEFAEILPPVVPLADQLGIAARAARPAAQAAMTAGRAAVPAAVQRVQQATAPIQRAAGAAGEVIKAPIKKAGDLLVPSKLPPLELPDSANGGRSIGAAETAAANQRRAVAESMPVPFTGESGYTIGQATRDPAWVRFEKEAVKREGGEDLRERTVNQTRTVYANLDHVAESFDPASTENRAIGAAIDRPLRNRMAIENRKVDQAYTAAREAGEFDQQVNTDGLAQALNGFITREGVAPNARAVRLEALRLGLVAEDEAGNLVGRTARFGETETLRQFVGKVTKWEDDPQSFAGASLKGAIDAIQSTVDSPLLTRGRQLRTQFAREFENVGLTREILSTKRGTTDRKVAIEDVYSKIMSAPLDSMNAFRATLLKSGPEGVRAWNTIKAKGIEELKAAAMTNNKDEAGQRTLSQAKLNNAIRAMDADGRLQSLYGKRQAQMIRDLGDIANDIYDAPPGTVNYSGSASALATFLDTAGTFMISGIPAPALKASMELAKYARNKEAMQRIRQTLSDPNATTGKF